ncbi:MAG: Nif11-like leader peptide family natural product precursor [Synechococcus sp.]|jgi:predicted ribosomally synthesized peptide with nif11-like leader|uniref:Nif11-like leader peptide family natural product precursor n=1 Tax=unclassified Synechococcus TaxID=2626047 RepID=UPI0001525BAC|nr:MULTISPECIES: Nif11-like leader peptide family natural product precursor [unclassified Synechococcus]MCT0251706.1 Nif11-like leader peptide family natural product precursor [Synechococcus sp. CS-197]PTT95942.1 Nif11-like leader peptide family natural product precursor [Pseudomonas sp. HMWF031]QNI66946.1 nif11-like leader peptide domain protein [Synechococcus sp. BMK-MC-1]CAK23149.1 Conserved hpothetical protein [Synechococcus sp. WH 7803]
MTPHPQLEAFLSKVKGDPDLLKQFHSAECLNDIAAMGAGMGFQFKGVDILLHQASATLKLSPDALEALAAGVELEGHLWKMAIQWT